MKREYNLEALEKQREDILLKIKRLEAQLVAVDTAIHRGKEGKKLTFKDTEDNGENNNSTES